MSGLLTQLLRRASWLLAAVIVAVIVLRVSAFQRPAYWLSLPREYFATAALALALTPIMLTGGIDLSVGSTTVLVTVVIGALWRDLGWPMEWALPAGVALGLAAGFANGSLVIAGVPPLVATLATRELYRGLAHTVSGANPVDRLPPELRSFWNMAPLGLPLPLLVLGGLFLVSYLFVHHTWMGRMVFALGDNEQAARFAAVPVRRLKLGLYGWSGLVAGLCGAALVMKTGAAKADAEKSLELLAIACVLLGGIRIVGGAGHVAGTLLGIVTVCILLAGMNSIASNWRDTLTGCTLVAVALTNEAAARWAACRAEN
jgi:ribose/xylose/arabinose/galactoside ABC-type transport system permease subunit